jgi:hypothetical protein
VAGRCLLKGKVMMWLAHKVGFWVWVIIGEDVTQINIVELNEIILHRQT